jgi:hypothetical protein
MADSPPPVAPALSTEVAAPFTTGLVLGRLARRLELDERSRIIEYRVQARSAGVMLARELGCRVTVADPSADVLARVRQEAEAAGVQNRLSLLELDAGAAALPEGAFELAISSGRARPLATLAALVRPVLVPSKGRLVAVVAVRVGPAAQDMGPWERALGALRTPQGELAELMRSGFEPEWAEALSETQLVELYGAGAAHPDEEAALVQSGPSGVSFVLVAGRRREPNEAPPPAGARG